MQWLLDAKYPVAFFINGLGDNIINLPALRALAKIFQGRLSFICSGKESPCFFNDLPLRRQIRISVVNTGQGCEFDFENILEQVGNCDLFISLVPWCSSSLTQLVEKLRPVISIGFFPSYDIEIPLDFNKHSADLAFDIVRCFDPTLRIRDFTTSPAYPNAALAEARSFLDMLPPGTRTLALHADTVPKKMWDAGNFTKALDIFLSFHKDFMALLVGHTRQPLDSGSRGDRVIPCYGLSLSVSLSLVSQVNIFLGVDSCMLHAADFARVPGVGLFGPTRAEEFGFLVGPNITIQSQGAMEQIEVDEVCDALNSIIADPKQSTIWEANRRKTSQMTVNWAPKR